MIGVGKLGNGHRVSQGRGDVGKQGLHLGRGLEVLVTRELLDAARVAQGLALGNAGAGLMGLKVVQLQELDGVGGHHGQLQAGGQGHGSADVRFVGGVASPLQLDVEAPWEGFGQFAGLGLGFGHVAVHQSCTHTAQLCAREADQAFVALGQRGPMHPGVAALAGGCPGLTQQFAQAQVALAVLDEQQQARGALGTLFRLHPHIGADDGLNTLFAR